MKDFNNKAVNANLIIGLTTLTGKLCFFENDFVFKANSVNSTMCYPPIAYREIAEVKAKNTLGFIPNGITVVLNNGESYSFVVMRRNDIKNYLTRKSQG